MKINVYPFEASQKRIKKLTETFQVPENVNLDVALDTVHGLNELTRSVALLHPHKLSIATLGALPAPLDGLVKGFKSEGYKVQEIPVNLLSSNWEGENALQELKKDTVFILASAQEPFTGIKYPWEKLRDFAKEKKIFLITYFAPAALGTQVPIPQSDFEGVVLDPLWGQELAPTLLLKGSRLKGDPLLWGQPEVSEVGSMALQKTFQTPVEQSKEKALEFEKTLSQKYDFVTAPCMELDRVYDRGILTVKDHHADELKHQLGQKNIQVESLASCSWNHPLGFSWLVKGGFQELDIQSTIVVPLSEMTKEGFEIGS